jgi:hypothetical protein
MERLEANHKSWPRSCLSEAAETGSDLSEAQCLLMTQSGLDAVVAAILDGTVSNRAKFKST